MHSFKSIAFVLFTLAASSFAAPQSYPNDAARKINKCSLGSVKLPSGVDELPSPAGALNRVLLGVGSQKYTCTSPSADVTPVANGAVADLYDASCIAKDPKLFLKITKRVHELNKSNRPGSTLQRLVIGAIGNSLKVGTHYFTNPTTPKFDFAPASPGDFFLGAKKGNVESPEGKTNVDWLFLESTDTTKGYTGVYRVGTQGGTAPANCKNQKANIEVKYVAQYFLYQNKS